ncbi:MAG TPA: hypothetical protein PLI03_02810, partial [Chitinophagales bacterium]|nr:hypothetical protein [Chitinophagales bacterium]
SFVNNQKTFPKEYVIPEAEEVKLLRRPYQESPVSVSVHLSLSHSHAPTLPLLNTHYSILNTH